MKRALIKLEFRDCYYLAFHVDKVNDMLFLPHKTKDLGHSRIKGLTGRYGKMQQVLRLKFR